MGRCGSGHFRSAQAGRWFCFVRWVRLRRWALTPPGHLVRLCDSQSGSPDCRYRALSYRPPSDLYRDYRGGDRAGARQRNSDSVCLCIAGRVWLLGERRGWKKISCANTRRRSLRFLSPPVTDACAIRARLRRCFQFQTYRQIGRRQTF